MKAHVVHFGRRKAKCGQSSPMHVTLDKGQVDCARCVALIRSETKPSFDEEE